MSVVLLIAAAAILGGVIAVAFGRGGELASFAADVPQAQAEIVTAADIALIRPPTALLGYNQQVTDDLLGTLARTVSDRDAEIASLRRKLDDLRGIGESRPLPIRRPGSPPGSPADTGPVGPTWSPRSAGGAAPAGPAGPVGRSGSAGPSLPPGSAGSSGAGPGGFAGRHRSAQSAGPAESPDARPAESAGSADE